MLSIVSLPDLVVPDNPGTTSNALRASTSYADAEEICIIAPSNAQVGTIQVSHDGTTYVALQSMEEASTLGTAKDVATPVASKARYYKIIAAFFRIVTAAPTGAATYKVFKRVETT